MHSIPRQLPLFDLAARQCAYCGTMLVAPRPNQRFCDARCLRSHQRDLLPRRPCLVCGAMFRVRSNAGQRFCSRACYESARRHVETCKHCGMEFRCKGKSHGQMPRFCSTTCQHAARRKDGPGRHGISSWRRQVRARDRVCQDCGADKDLQAHHIKEWAEHPALRYDLSNGVLLCAVCHQARHPVVPFITLRDGTRGAQVHYCADCQAPIGPHTRTGLCRPCVNRRRRLPLAHCRVCGVPLCKGPHTTGCCGLHAPAARPSRKGMARPAKSDEPRSRRRGKVCMDCGVPIADYGVSGYCRAHAVAHRAPRPRLPHFGGPAHVPAH